MGEKPCWWQWYNVLSREVITAGSLVCIVESLLFGCSSHHCYTWPLSCAGPEWLHQGVVCQSVLWSPCCLVVHHITVIPDHCDAGPEWLHQGVVCQSVLWSPCCLLYMTIVMQGLSDCIKELSASLGKQLVEHDIRFSSHDASKMEILITTQYGCILS